MPRLIDSFAARVFQYLADSALASTHTANSALDVLYRLTVGNPGANPAANSTLDRLLRTVALSGADTALSVSKILADLVSSDPGAAAAANSYIGRIPTGSNPMPVAITPDSRVSLGPLLATQGLAAPASGSVGANRLIYVPFTVTESTTLAYGYCVNGASVAGTIDIGIVNESGTRQVRFSALQAGTNAMQTFDIADTTLTTGRYYAAIVNDGAGTWFGHSLVNNAIAQSMGIYRESGAAATIPVTATFATYDALFVPIFGFTKKTVV